MERKIVFSEGEYYHIYNRGVDKRYIFDSDEDRERFVKLLFLANADKPIVYRDIKDLPLEKIDRGNTKVAIGAYVLMPNHFHLLLRMNSDGGISSFMEKFITGYSTYFNKRYDRVGPLFQGRFKAEHVDNDEYLKYLFAYIHLNPVKLIDSKWREEGIRDRLGAEKYLDGYRWSSYLDYVGREREEGLILTKEEFPEYFLGAMEFKDYVRDWLEYEETSK